MAKTIEATVEKGSDEKPVTPDVTMASGASKNENSGTFIKVKNVSGRPIEIIFNGSTLRIAFCGIAYVDESKLKIDKFAKSQFDKFVSNNDLRVLKRNCKERG